MLATRSQCAMVLETNQSHQRGCRGATRSREAFVDQLLVGNGPVGEPQADERPLVAIDRAGRFDMQTRQVRPFAFIPSSCSKGHFAVSIPDLNGSDNKGRASS
jgi:hypothetical protein